MENHTKVHNLTQPQKEGMIKMHTDIYVFKNTSMTGWTEAWL